MASAPDKFNDVGWGKWQLVRVDREIVEYDSYFASRADYQEALTTGSRAVATAGAVLATLEEADWRDLWSRAYGLPFHEEFLALIVEHGALWVLYATSNQGGRDHVFTLGSNGGRDQLEYFGECVDRMDDHLSGLDGNGSDVLQFRLDDPA